MGRRINLRRSRLLRADRAGLVGEWGVFGGVEGQGGGWVRIDQ